MESTPEALIGTLLASAVGAFVAAWFSFRYALSRFQRERAFDRRLAWYEKAVGQLLAAYDRINWALAAGMVDTSADRSRVAWNEAYQALYQLRALAAEAELYATPQSIEVVREVSDQVIGIAQTTLRLGAPGETETSPPPGRLISIAGKMLRHAASTLAADLRSHLGLAEVHRPWSIYDHDYRAFIEELRALKQQGLDFSGDAWDLADEVEGNPDE